MPPAKGPLEMRYDTLRGLVNDLDATVGVGEVYITGYPIGLFDARTPAGQLGFKSCEIFEGPDMDLTAADGRMIKEHGHRLNELIARKAREFQWHYVDVEKEFEGHGYCSNEAFWHKAAESCRHQGDFNGTMHPNAEGISVWAGKFAQAISNTHATEAKPRSCATRLGRVAPRFPSRGALARATNTNRS